MMAPCTKEKGFTLIEMLVYIAIFMIVSTASVTLLLSLDDFIDQYQVETALYRSGSSIMEQVVVELRQADQFDVANSLTENSSTGVLAIVNGAATTRFTKLGDDIVLTKDDVNFGNLNSERVIVTGFTVYRYTSAAGTLVRVHLQLATSVDDTTKTVDLYGGAIIRGAI
jgi:prepilin-type N-terminal cleavage/methylation domain-containing protein